MFCVLRGSLKSADGVKVLDVEIEPDVPLIPVTVSAAMMVQVPTVFNVAVNVPTPLVSVEFAGSTAAPSVLVKWTVPE